MQQAGPGLTPLHLQIQSPMHVAAPKMRTKNYTMCELNCHAIAGVAVMTDSLRVCKDVWLMLTWHVNIGTPLSVGMERERVERAVNLEVNA